MKLLALLYFALSLVGVDVGGSTSVTRTVVNGADVLYSRATTEAGMARFECVRSASGQCHYTVYPRACRSADCHVDPLTRFAVADGSTRRMPGLRGFHVCVSARDTAPAPDCGPIRRVAGGTR